jgi:hypothetical protein
MGALFEPYVFTGAAMVSTALAGLAESFDDRALEWEIAPSASTKIAAKARTPTRRVQPVRVLPGAPLSHEECTCFINSASRFLDGAMAAIVARNIVGAADLAPDIAEIHYLSSANWASYDDNHQSLL